MKTLISIGVICLGLAFGSWLRTAVWQPRQATYSFFAHMVSALNNETEVLCVGSSHVFRGCDPSEFTRPTANLALGGLNYVVAEQLLATHLDRVPQLKIAVVELDPVLIHYDTIGVRKQSSDYKEMFEAGLSANQFNLDLAGKLQELLPHRRFPSLGPYELRTIFFPLYSETPGYLPVPFKEHRRDVCGAKRRAKIHSENSSDAGPSLAALQKIIGRLETKNVTPYFIIYPKMSGYWSYLPKFQLASLKEVRSIVEEEGYAVLDLRAEPQFQEADFRDGDHLNESGARKLSKLLNTKINELLRDTAKLD